MGRGGVRVKNVIAFNNYGKNEEEYTRQVQTLQKNKNLPVF